MGRGVRSAEREHSRAGVVAGSDAGPRHDIAVGSSVGQHVAAMDAGERGGQRQHVATAGIRHRGSRANAESRAGPGGRVIGTRRIERDARRRRHARQHDAVVADARRVVDAEEEAADRGDRILRQTGNVAVIGVPL